MDYLILAVLAFVLGIFWLRLWAGFVKPKLPVWWPTWLGGQQNVSQTPVQPKPPGVV